MNWRLVSLVLGLVISGALAWLWPRITEPPAPHAIAQTLLDAGRPRDAVLLFENKTWRGVGEYLAGRYRRAADEFASPNTILELYNLGTAHAQLGEWGDAITAYQRVLRLDPNHADARHNLELVLVATNLGRAEITEPPTELSPRDGQDDEEGNDTEADGGPDTQSASKSETANKESEEVDDQATGKGNEPGDVGDREAADSSETVTIVSEPDDAVGDEAPEGSGSVDLVARESTQAAEILLRLITDDPERVLRVRLHTEHQNRIVRTP